MVSSGDEFDAYNLDEFTTEDFAFVDRTIARDDIIAKTNGGPAVTVEVEQSIDLMMLKDPLIGASSPVLRSLGPQQPSQPSPFQRFRAWRKVLSVSDLVSPAWYAMMG
jgi:hypothetical protein